MGSLGEQVKAFHALDLKLRGLSSVGHRKSQLQQVVLYGPSIARDVNNVI